MYESPIELIYSERMKEIKNGVDDTIIRAVMNVGINVDKDELIKALNYDRNQYTKGYKDGTNDILDKIRAEIMELDVFFDNDYFSGNKEAMLKRNKVLRIIYKYKALDQDRDCEHCVHHTDKGCSSWDCEFERRTE